jgi:hypothetical protein
VAKLYDNQAMQQYGRASYTMAEQIWPLWGSRYSAAQQIHSWWWQWTHFASVNSGVHLRLIVAMQLVECPGSARPRRLRRGSYDGLQQRPEFRPPARTHANENARCLQGRGWGETIARTWPCTRLGKQAWVPRACSSRPDIQARDRCAPHTVHTRRFTCDRS